MHPVVAASIATELDHYAERARHETAWPSPGTGFAMWLSSRLSLISVLPPSPTIDLAEIREDRISEAPILAAYGYLLATREAPVSELAGRWSAAALRLSVRDPLPNDRASFFFRPIELLGIALGAVTVAETDPGPRDWLRQVLRDGAPRLGSDIRSVATVICASAALGARVPNKVPTSGGETLTELGFLWLAASIAPDAAREAGLDRSIEQLESDLLHSTVQGREPSTDTAEAALLVAAITRATRTGLTPNDYGLPAALNTVETLLRRFPTIVRELARRHDSRPALAQINDEYDVQDLLRGILFGLFDDVRDEEPTPSRGGVTSRVDLLLKREQIFIEVKMTRPSLNQRAVAKQLVIDMEFYRSHQDCKTLVCFVYDPNHHLSNPVALEDDLTDRHSPLPTVIIVAPH